MAVLKKGTKVRVKGSVAMGVIVGYEVSDDEKEFKYSVDYFNPDDGPQPEVHNRRFAEEELVVLPAEPQGGAGGGS